MRRAVLFDVDGVLVHSLFHSDPARRRRWDEHLLEDMGVSPQAFSALFKNGFDDVVTGKQSLVTVLDDFLPTLGYRGRTMDFIGYWLARDTHLNLQLLDVIKALRTSGAADIYMATNQEHLRAHHLWHELRLSHLFDDMFYAARLGAMKPDGAFFEAVTQRLGPQEEKPLFFDDSAAVIAAANAFGWEGVLFEDVGDCRDHKWVASNLENIIA
jgi:putative hydrolase of the HAD superfamily